MNKVILMGRLTRDPDVRRTQDGMAVARYTLAIDRKTREKAADFISCVAWDKKGEFAEQYLRKGTKIAVTGHIQTGKYTDRNGNTVYTTDVVVEDQEFAESKQSQERQKEAEEAPNKGFVSIPDDSDINLPFS